VLVVDDSEDIRTLVQTALVTSGFIVHQAASGVEALTATARLLPDCVVLDVDMPDMSGLEALRHLRKDAGPDVALVMLTGSVGFQAKAEAFALGADDYIVKPISPRDLVARIERVLRSSHREA
jgi:DNA-binding response OmpR family regulator